MAFEVTRQDKHWPRIPGVDHKYYIQNKILADCIGVGSGTMIRPGRVSGFNYSKGIGYALLTYFASQALGFRRLPFYEDRIYEKSIRQDSRQILENSLKISRNDVDEIVEEVKQIYQHTQKKLKEACLPTVKLRREIAANGSGYAETLMQLKDSAEVSGRQTIQFDMDTLNSFGDEGAYKHLADVTIEHEFQASDVFYCSNLIASEGDSQLVETGEWVIINRSPTGLVELPTNSVKYDSNNWKGGRPICAERAEYYRSKYEPIEYRNVTYIEDSFAKHGRSMKIRKIIARLLLLNSDLS